MNQHRVLGIDPGSYCTGVSLLLQDGNSIKCLYSDSITPKKSDPLSQRLALIYEQLDQIVSQWQPQSLSLETIFYSKNVKALSSLAHARGVCLMLGAKHALSIHEYSPIEVKKGSVGYGRADKEQVAAMMARLFPLLKTAKTHDQTDSAAIALCHINTWKLQQKILQGRQ